MKARIALAACALVALAATATTAVAHGPESGATSLPALKDTVRGGDARNVILLIGDGMGVTHIDAARLRYAGAAGRLAMQTMPGFGSVRTYAVVEGTSRVEPVTDSASAGVAWASGVKTYNAAIGEDALGKVVPTFMEQAKQRGMRTGNVSTAEITDATPAVQFSHVAKRGCQGPDFTADACKPGEAPIAEQIARNNVADVILGGGLARFEPDDADAMAKNGYTVAGSFGNPTLDVQTAASQKLATRDDLSALNGSNRRVIALFNRGNMTVETAKADAANASSPVVKEPNLAQMTSKAIELLAASDGARKHGFFLQIEGALIDKRSHANDANQTLGEMKAFDDAVKAAVDYARKDGNTLVIVTADHECAGFNIIAKGSFANSEATAPPANADSGNVTNSSKPVRAGGKLDVTRSTGPINGSGSASSGNFAPATFRTLDDPAGVVDGSPDASLWLTYLSGNHTGANVNIYAYGPGSARFDEEIDNTDIYYRMRNSTRSFG